MASSGWCRWASQCHSRNSLCRTILTKSWKTRGSARPVLSFQGLAFNLAYGGVGLLFAGLNGLLGKFNPRIWSS